MCILNEQQIRQVYLRCNCIPLQKLVELCMNPNTGITLEMLRKVGYRQISQLEELCREHLLEDIRSNPSSYSREKMYDIISNNILSREDLVDNYSILTDRAYEHIKRYPCLIDEQRALPFSHTEKPYSERGNIDVFFFGVPGSGKTCLFAGLMGLTGQLGFQFDPRGLGGGGSYAVELQNYARCSILPPRSDQSFIQVVDAQLNDNAGFPHKISLIEMSGIKIAESAFSYNPLNLDDLGVGATGLLKNDNKKILFFVIDPSNEVPVVWNDYGNPIKIKQSDAIQSVLSILRGNRNVMRNIEVIHIILTKCDSLGENISYDVIQELFMQQGYMECIQYANTVCQEYCINGRTGYSVGVYPFSLGKFMPGDTYTYDETRALMILRAIQGLLPIKPQSPLSGFIA